MRRRVARVVRWLILALGVLLLAWTPVSFLYAAAVNFIPKEHSSSFECCLMAKDGALWFMFIGSEPSFWNTEMRGNFVRNPNVEYSRAFLPRNGVEPYLGIRELSCPLWLLAFICLAWPMTSLLLARRRHKRGFPVEPARNPNEETRNPNETRMTE